MNQVLKQIVGEIPPPTHPQHLSRDWVTVESQLGMMLPDDYKEFVSLYGSGVFDPLELNVWNLSVVKPDVDSIVGQHEFCHDAEDRARPTLLEFAQEVQLYPWGEGAALETLFWAMTGPVEQWYVIVSTDDYGKYHRFPNHRTTDFLADLLLARDADVTQLWSADCFAHPQEFLATE